MWTQLNEKLKTILEANTKIQEVYDWEKEQFNGDPVATLSAASNESNYATTSENVRVYSFSIKLFVNRNNRTDQDSERIMRELVDTVVDDLDKNYTLTGINNPAGKTLLFIEAIPSAWGYVELDGIYRMAEIIVKAHINIDLNLIS
ncbi:MAG TPA: hypothetical protein VJL60_03015 [Gammaproteobacteria bacterium]|nr:hypothetical protein [Gammaproteobacteria bacterium]